MRILFVLAMMVASVFAETFGGIGVTIQSAPKGVQVVTVIPNSQASLNGIEAGDQITAVNEIALAGKPLEECTALLRGQAGSKAVVSFVKAKDGEVRSVELTRVGLQVQTLSAAELNSWYNSSSISSKEIEHVALTRAEAGNTLLGVLQYGRLISDVAPVTNQEISTVYQIGTVTPTPSSQMVKSAGVNLLGFDRQNLQIELKSTGTVQAQLFDMQGSLVKSWRVDNASGSLNLAWDGKSQATGAYSIRVQQGSALSSWNAQLQ